MKCLLLLYKILGKNQRQGQERRSFEGNRYSATVLHQVFFKHWVSEQAVEEKEWVWLYLGILAHHPLNTTAVNLGFTTQLKLDSWLCVTRTVQKWPEPETNLGCCASLMNGTSKRMQQTEDGDKIHIDANDPRVQPTVKFSPSCPLMNYTPFLKSLLPQLPADSFCHQQLHGTQQKSLSNTSPCKTRTWRTNAEEQSLQPQLQSSRFHSASCCQHYKVSDTKRWAASLEKVFVPLLIGWN